MPNPFAPGGSSPFAARSTKKQDEDDRGAFDFVGNLVGDVKDAVVGLPAGLVETARNPIKSAKAIGGASWHTWSPLFSGDFEKFGQQLYDHPLAPLLDVATVFTLGAAGTARGASALSKAGVKSSKLSKVAGLAQPKYRTLSDPTNQARHDLTTALSNSPGRRLLQEGRIRYLDPHLPKWVSDNRYERTFTGEMSRRGAARNQVEADALQYVTLLKAGEALDNPATQREAFREIGAGMWQSLDRHAPKTIQPGEKRPKNYAYMLDAAKFEERLGKIESPEQFERFLKSYGRRATTRSEANAARRADGSLVLVPLHNARNLGLEAANSSRAVRLLWRKPTTFWKSAVIGYTVRAITNNAVGNWVIYAVRQGGHNALAGLYDAIRITKGERVAKHLNQPGLYGSRTGHWAQKWHLDELGNTFRQSMELDVKGRTRKRLAEGVYPVVNATSDKPVRLATLSAFYRGNPDVQKLRKKGYTFDQAVDAVIANNPELRAAASQHVRTVAGDYASMRGWERTTRDIVPFYLWDRHILKTAGNMLLEQPGRAAAIQRISNLGVERTEELLGEVPEFLRGALPLELLGFEKRGGGRADALLTHSLNPFSTLGDLAGMVEGLTTGGGIRPGASALSQTNPIFTGLIEATTGQSLLTGAPKDGHGGILPSTVAGLGLGLPQIKLGQALLSKDTETGRTGNDLLFARDDRSPVTSFLGVPLRNISLQAAERISELEKPKRKKKKRKKKQYNPFAPSS